MDKKKLKTGVIIAILVSIQSLNSIFYDAFDGIASDVYDLTYLKEIKFYQFDSKIITQSITTINATVGNTMRASLGNIVFDVDDMQVSYKENEKVNDYFPLVFGTDINMKINIGKYAQPQNRYYQYDTLTVPKISPNSVKGGSSNPRNSPSPSPSPSGADANPFILNCTFSGEGLLFNLTKNKIIKELAYDVNSYDNLNFVLINSILYVQPDNSTRFQFDIYFGISDEAILTASMKFKDIFIIHSVDSSFNALAARTEDSIYIWEFISPKKVKFYLNVTSKDKNLLENTIKIGFFKSKEAEKIIFGVKNTGVIFETLSDSPSTSIPTLELKLDDNKSNLYDTSSLKDLVVLGKSIYILASGEGIYILDIETMGLEKTIQHPNLIGIDVIPAQDTQTQFIYVGLAVNNDPENKIKEFFIELVVDKDDEFNPSINKAYISNKKIDYDEAIISSNSKTLFVDKLGQRLIILLRGIPNLRDIPNYSIDLDTVYDWSKVRLNLYSYAQSTSNTENIIEITDGKSSIILGEIQFNPFLVRCQFNSPGIYNFNFKGGYDCTESDTCIREFEQIFFINSTTVNGLTLTDDHDDQTYIPILIILILLIVVVVLVLILKKLGILCRKGDTDVPTGSKNVHSKLPNNYETPKDNLNISGNPSIQIDVKHEPLEDEKI